MLRKSKCLSLNAPYAGERKYSPNHANLTLELKKGKNNHLARHIFASSKLVLLNQVQVRERKILHHVRYHVY